ncbi:MAG: hypothetical protein QOJ40_2502 [Verrucomicrobiota bacterium]
MAKWWYGDRDWFAVDGLWHLAAFVTAGQGDVPTHLLPRYLELEQLSDNIVSLPMRGGCDLLHNYPRPEDFVDYASRGIFAYDWMEVHLTANRRQHYYLIARPQSPLALSELPPSFRESFSLVRFESLRFTDTPHFSIRDAIENVTVA